MREEYRLLTGPLTTTPGAVAELFTNLRMVDKINFNLSRETVPLKTCMVQYLVTALSLSQSRPKSPSKRRE